MIGEVYLPVDRVVPYLDYFDTVFAFDLLHAEWDAGEIAAAIDRSNEAGSVAWVTSNHDFPRAASRWGEQNARAAAVLLMTLGGTAFIYQGEEIGMIDGEELTEPLDRFGRDGCRRPMQWEGGKEGGFTTGRPWLPPVDPEVRNVFDQRDDPDSLLNLFRRLIAVRREIDGRPRIIDSPPGTVAYQRGVHLIVINLGCESAEMGVPQGSALLLAALPGGARVAERRLDLAARSAAVMRSG